ncbi:expressed unknown protein [Seminavis robusta]|uniref:Uncharacterized protein n=1 Tax=Seminavis robusta TaxID=568900 RepID=A0A9N8DF42_9STRA|nr:expressed unknown protein [Seminavis robusta]|eukprot:Sro113_g056160.1 n/a (1166) ;mRNA; f:103409-107911
MRLNLWLLATAVFGASAPVLVTGQDASPLDLKLVPVKLESENMGSVREYSTVMYEVLDGINHVKKVLEADQMLTAHEISSEAQMEKLSTTSKMLHKAVQDFQSTPEVEMAPAELQIAIEQLSKELEETHTVVTAAVARDLGTTTSQPQRRLDLEGENPTQKQKHPLIRQYSQHRKLRRHLDIHDKLTNGDHSFVNDLMSRLSQGSRRTRSHGRNLATANETLVETCDKVVACMNEYTLFDFVAYFYGDYVGDDGVIDSDKIPKKQGYKDFFDKLGAIRDVMKTVSTDNGSKVNNCRKLMREMHKNELSELYNETYYEKYVGPSWREVCSAEGSTKYIKLEEIKNKVGKNVAYHLFEDMALCAEDIGDPILFDDDGLARVPIKPDSDKRFQRSRSIAGTRYDFDEYGQPGFPIEPKAFFRYVTLDPLQSSQFRIVHPDCYHKVNKYFKDVVLRSHFNISNVDYLGRSYPNKIVWDCDQTEQHSDTNRDYKCTVKIDNKDICGVMEVKNKRYHPSTEDVVGSGVVSNTLEEGSVYSLEPFDMDDTMSILLGPKKSIGLVCAFSETTKEMPGYCCLDQPWEREGDLFGVKYACEETKEKCNHIATGLGGFSEDSCKIYSGTYCTNPVDCSALSECVKSELEWAKANKRATFAAFLGAAPQANDTSSFAACADLKEYFGFPSEYPDVLEICEDISYLRYDSNFEKLDGSDSGSSGELPDMPETEDLKPPKTHAKNSNYYNDQVVVLYQLEKSTLTLEKVYDLLDAFTCPTGIPWVTQGCQTVKNIAIVIAFLAKWDNESSSIVLDYKYGQDQISDFDMYTLSENAAAVFGNMKLLNANLKSSTGALYKTLGAMQKEIITIKETVKSSSARRLGHLSARTMVDSDGSITEVLEVRPLPSLGWEQDKESGLIRVPQQVFQSAEHAINFLHSSLSSHDDGAELNITEAIALQCSSEFEVLPVPTKNITTAINGTIGMAKKFLLAVDTKSPVVHCGFSKDSVVSSDGKALLLSEKRNDGGLLDSTFWYTIKDDCSKTVVVDVVVSSNEFDERTSVFLAKSVTGGSKQAKVLVAPTTCKGRNLGAGLCHSSSTTTERVYDIRVTATDSSGLVGVDTCHIVVTPPHETDGNVGDSLGSNKSVRGARDGLAELLDEAAKDPQFEVAFMTITTESTF